ncbi:MAG TPA: CHASE sensor domain-containing protein, partial [Steroidobacteraceae bacterium]|nr:CHASE sensor domain-containing protein [Steroidobacteraceae bacterium]
MAPLEDSAAMRSQPIQWVLMRIILLSGLAVLVATVGAFSGYELLAFRNGTIEQLRTLSTAIASNTTAALAFDDSRQAATVLAALQAEPHMRAAALYDAHGKLFATWPAQLPPGSLPKRPGARGYRFRHGMLVGFQDVHQGSQSLGTLYVQSDLGALYTRAMFYGVIVLALLAVSLPLAYLLSRRLRNQMANPIMALVDIARAVSERQDYSVRAAPTGAREFDLFISSFNEMMTRIQQSEARLQEQLGRLDLLQQITRAIGERQDLPSIFQVVLGTLEENLPIDFGCFLLYDAAARELTVSTMGAASRNFAAALALDERQSVPIDANGLSRCVAGHLVHEPDVQDVPFPFPSRLAGAGLRSLVIAPLAVENQVFGVLACARREAHSFSSVECEFLRQLSEHVALASHQARLNGALQQAYDDLRQSQQTVMQQERLRALGQMASGIAHDINNAISPVSLYTESLLEREPGLSDRARGYLSTIQRAIEDVARTVSRMREFYREREAQLTLERVDL